MATQRQPGLHVLSAAAANQFNVYLKAKSAKQRADRTARKADEQKKDAQQAVTEEMGDAMRASLPDGSIVQRLKKGMHRKAQPARDVAWEELIQADD